MKSFKALMLLTLAATLSCGANGSPTNVTTDGYPTNPSPAVLKGIMGSLQDIANPYFNQYKEAYPFTKEYVGRLAWVRPYNYIIIKDKVDMDFNFDGKVVIDWDNKPIYRPTSNNEQPTEWYQVFVVGSGWFERKGKGNWAWNGFIAQGQDIKSNRIVFAKPRTGRQTEGGGD